jgi:hypothetical protein
MVGHCQFRFLPDGFDEITAKDEGISRLPFDRPRDQGIAVVADFDRAPPFAKEESPGSSSGRSIRAEQ